MKKTLEKKYGCTPEAGGASDGDRQCLDLSIEGAKWEALKQEDEHYLGKNVVFIEWISGGTGLVGRGQSQCWCCSGLR